jgi:hypothetical protein
MRPQRTILSFAYIVMLLLCSTHAGSQDRLTTCISWSDQTPGPSVRQLDIDQDEPQELWFVFQAAEPLYAPKMYFFLDRKNPDGSRDEIRTFLLRPEAGSRLIRQRYLMAYEGLYELSVTDARKNILYTTEISVKWKQKVIFCEAVNDAFEAIEPKNTFRFDAGQNRFPVQVLVNYHDKPLGYEQLILKCFRSDSGTLESETLHTVRPEWTKAVIRLPGLRPGRYRIQVLNEVHIPIGENTIELVK